MSHPGQKTAKSLLLFLILKIDMKTIKNINELIKKLSPKLNKGEYVFCSVNNLKNLILKKSLELLRKKRV